MDPKKVFVPADLPEGLGGPAIIRDADDWPHKVLADYLTLVESRPCVTAEVLGELRGRFRVRFPDGHETWVAPCPAWDHEPAPDDRVTLGRG